MDVQWLALDPYSTYSTYSKDAGDCEGLGLVPAAPSLPAAPPARHRSLIASTCRVDMLRLGTPGATRPRHLPGIGALPSPHQGRDSSQEKKCRGCRLSRQL